MSDYRHKTATLKLVTSENKGKKTVKIELFSAVRWRQKHRPWKKVMFPRPPLNNDIKWWQLRYRLRVNGKWHGKRANYVFYTRDQVCALTARLLVVGLG